MIEPKNIKAKYRYYVKKLRVNMGSKIAVSGELPQLNDSGDCTFCGQHYSKEFTQYEKMVVFITSIKSNPTASLLTADYLGFLVGWLRDTYCPDVTVEQCKELIHSVSHLKDVALEQMDRAKVIAENIGNARFELFETDHGMLKDNDDCTCKCHQEGKLLCDNCSGGAKGVTKTGIWHMGYEEKQLLYAFAETMGVKL